MQDGIPWPNIITTLVVFCIFVWLAKKLFWKPFLDTIDERQAKIQGEFDKIDAMQAQVTQLQADYSKRLADIEAEARQKMQEAMAQGKAIADQVAEQARQDAEATRAKAEQALAIEVDKARHELKQEVVRLTLAATEKVARQNMNDARQQELVNNFVEELARR